MHKNKDITLCDIGNTNATFYQNGSIRKLTIDDFLSFVPTDRIYYISVNDVLSKHLKAQKLFVDLEPHFILNSQYKGLGIDRVAACTGVSNGVIVDAGSAITVDIMDNGYHKGGFILPGISKSLKAYESISTRLKIALNTKIKLDLLPQNTQDAVSFGIIAPILSIIAQTVGGRRIYFTGGDGEFLSCFFENAIYDRMLVFRSMQQLIKQKRLDR